MKKPSREFTDAELVAGSLAIWILGLTVAIVVVAVGNV